MGIRSVDGEGKPFSFDLLFQRDVRGYGSCLGWGLGTEFSGGFSDP